jgi:hypothetical protein
MRDDLQTWHLALAALVVIALCYPLGYLLVDTLRAVSVNSAQARDGYIHVFRVLTGLLCLVPPMMAWMVWEVRGDRGE